jgi:hypothetical protein
MTPTEVYSVDQERIEQQSEIANELFIDGQSDAAMGESPQSKDAAYLDGYLSQLRSLILDSSMTLQIRWLSPAYLAEAFDGVDGASELF